MLSPFLDSVGNLAKQRDKLGTCTLFIYPRWFVGSLTETRTIRPSGR